MTKPMKPPLIRRLSRIEAWRKARHRKAMRSGDIAKAMRAAHLYVASAARANGLLSSMVQPYT